MKGGILIKRYLINKINNNIKNRIEINKLNNKINYRLYSQNKQQEIITNFNNNNNINNINQNNKLDKKKIVFLGTPSFASDVLKQLIEESNQYNIEICGIVTKPSLIRIIKSKQVEYPSPVYIVGKDVNLPIYTPIKATEKSFLENIELIKPDLLITAAYGNYLPMKLLKIPKYGTINIHPSLLPKYRGASPVQRSLVNGDKIVGVSVLYTVKEMDAGPILTQSSITLEGNEKSDQVLSTLFKIGTNDLLKSLPLIFEKTTLPHDYTKPNLGIEQEHSLATQAPKIQQFEGNIDVNKMTSNYIHNLTRGFSDWPGVWCLFDIINSKQQHEIVRVRIITTIVLDPIDEKNENNNFNEQNLTVKEIKYYVPKGQKNGYLILECFNGTRLGILELQPQGKKMMTAKAFNNGLKDKHVFCYSIDENDIGHIQPNHNYH